MSSVNTFHVDSLYQPLDLSTAANSCLSFESIRPIQSNANALLASQRQKKKKMLITDKDQHTLGLGVHAVGVHASCGCRTEMHARAEKEDRGLPVLRK